MASIQSSFVRIYIWDDHIEQASIEAHWLVTGTFCLTTSGTVKRLLQKK